MDEQLSWTIADNSARQGERIDKRADTANKFGRSTFWATSKALDTSVLYDTETQTCTA